MRMRWPVIVAAVLAAGPLGVTSAVDAPHDASFSDGACERCHDLTKIVKTSSGLYDYNNVCLSCHDAGHNLSFNFPWLTTDQAKPGVSGNQHSWSGEADSPATGARFPTTIALQKMLVDGKIQCITCHDAHESATPDPDSKHTSFAIGTAYAESGNGTVPGDGAGAATMTLISASSTPAAFRLKVLDAGGGARSFIISHDFGLATPSWLVYTGSWVPETDATPGPGRAITPGVNVALDDGSVVRFSALPLPGDYWDFYVSFPFLRHTNVADGICAVCHMERVMDHTRARGEDAGYPADGIRKFSHPVGVGLNANNKGLDATVIADTNGAAQTVLPAANADGDASNDLVLRSNLVRCTTCHAVHNADSNSLTKDAR